MFYTLQFGSLYWLIPLVTAATTCLSHQPQMRGEGDCGAIGGMKIGKGNRSIRRKPAPAPLCLSKIPLDLAWARTRAAAMESQRLTAWAMARPLSRNLNEQYLIFCKTLSSHSDYYEEFHLLKMCSPLKTNRRFGGTYRLHHQGHTLSQARNQLDAMDYIALYLRRWNSSPHLVSFCRILINLYIPPDCYAAISSSFSTLIHFSIFRGLLNALSVKFPPSPYIDLSYNVLQVQPSWLNET
jgi:hypothetical protein